MILTKKILICKVLLNFYLINDEEYDLFKAIQISFMYKLMCYLYIDLVLKK